MCKIITFLFLLTVSASCFLASDSEYNCYEKFLKAHNFNQENDEFCKKLFDENLEKFNSTINDENESITLDDLECISNFLHSGEIAKIFLRAMAKNEVQENQSLRKSFDDLVRPSIRHVRDTAEMLCGLDMVITHMIQQSNLKKFIKPEKMSDRDMCLVKKFIDRHSTGDNANILNFHVNTDAVNCNQVLQAQGDEHAKDEATLNEIDLFDMTRKQTYQCNNATNKDDIYDPISLIFEHFDVTEEQEKVLRNVFISFNKNETSKAFKCMADLK